MEQENPIQEEQKMDRLNEVVTVYFDGGSMGGKTKEMHPNSVTFKTPDGEFYEIRKNDAGRYIGALQKAVIDLRSQDMTALSFGVTETVLKALDLDVIDKQSYDEASNIRKVLRQHRKQAEAVRLALVTPIKRHASNIDAHFRPIKKDIDDAETSLEKRQARWLDAERKKEEERQRKEQELRDEQALRNAEKLEEMGAPEIADQVLTQAEKVTQVEKQIQKPFLQKSQTAYASATAGIEWDFTVTNIEKVPAQFLLVDRAAVLREIKAQYARGVEVPNVLGLNVIKKTKVNVR